MKVYFKNNNEIVFEEENILLTLTIEEVEDIINAMEVDNSSLYLLINDTIISDAQERVAFRNLIRKIGGIEKGIDEMRIKLKDIQVKLEEEKKKHLEEKKAVPSASKQSPPKVQTTSNKPSDSGPRKSLSKEVSDKEARCVNRTPIQGKNFIVKWLYNGDVEVSYDEYVFKINKEKFLKLRKDMPSDTSGMFQVMLRDILEGQENKTAFRKILSTLGSSNFLSTLKIELEKIK